MVARSKLRDPLSVQVAYADGSFGDNAVVRSIGICAGSGASMLLGHPADVYFTGEMSHHEVLAAVASGHHVILCRRIVGSTPWL